MNGSACQIPYQPAIYGTKSKYSLFCTFTCTCHIIQQPFYFGGGEIGVDDQSCFLLYRFAITRFFQFITVTGSPAVLPDNCVMNRFTGSPVPNYSRFALVSDTNSGNITWSKSRFYHCFCSHTYLRRPYLGRIMLDMTG